MSKNDASKAVLPLLGTTLAGVMAGAAVFESVVDAPGRGEMKPAHMVQSFRAMYPRAKNLFLSGIAAIIPALCTTAYVTDAPLLYFACVPYGLMIPYTLTVLAPTNNRLMTISDDDVAKDDGSGEVVTLTAKWAKRHALRTAAYVTGFAMCLGSMANKYIL